MRLSKLATLIAIGALLTISIPVFADTYTVFSNPGDDHYLTLTTDYGGGDGSGGTISSLGTFNFSSGLVELGVPNSWATWNCPPFTESCTPNVLYTNGASSLTLTLTAPDHVAGFELEPDLFQVETIDATFYNILGQPITTITRQVNGSAGALLFALKDNTYPIGKIVITDEAGDDFAIAQLRQGDSTTPEPGTLVLLGTGLLGVLGVIRRRANL